MTNEARHLHLLQREPGDEAGASPGPLRLFMWLHEHAQHGQCKARKAEIAAALDTTDRSVYGWLTELERAGYVVATRRPGRPSEYVLVKPVEAANGLHAGVSGVLPDPLPDFPDSLPDHLPGSGHTYARDPLPPSPPSPPPTTSRLPDFPTSVVPASLTVPGFLIREFKINDPEVWAGFEELTERERAQFVVEMSRPGIRRPTPYAQTVLANMAVDRAADLLRDLDGIQAEPAHDGTHEPADSEPMLSAERETTRPVEPAARTERTRSGRAGVLVLAGALVVVASVLNRVAGWLERSAR